MALGCLLTLTSLRLSHVQIEDVVLGVVVDVVEEKRADFDLHLLHERGPFRFPNAEMIRAGSCS
jgi:hypothetical protein